MLLCLLLAAGALWFGRAALLTHDAFLAAEALLALVALGSAASGGRFTRYPVCLFALLLGGEWIASLWLSIRIGFFAHVSGQAMVRALLPGTLLILLLLYGCLVSVAFYGGRRREQSP